MMTSENRKKITYKAEDLQYPTKEELRFADSQCPKFSNFGFKHKSGLISILNGGNIEDVTREDNLFWWDNVLVNRFGSLRGAFFDALTHYNRGFKEDYKECSDKEVVNRLLFENNAEVFYYFFFVSTDVIAQILNLYFQLKMSEEKAAFNETLIRQISESEIRSILQKFYDDTKSARRYRNEFTHRFPSNYIDNRLKAVKKDNKIEVFFGAGSVVTSQKILENIFESLTLLSDFMKELKTYLVK